MAAFLPFEANVVTSLTGVGVNFAVTTSNQSATLVSTSIPAPTLLVAYGVANVPGGTSQGMAYIRLTKDSTQAATSADIPLAPNTVQLFANPVPFGSLTIQVIATVSCTVAPAHIISVCPGEGGV